VEARMTRALQNSAPAIIDIWVLGGWGILGLGNGEWCRWSGPMTVLFENFWRKATWLRGSDCSCIPSWGKDRLLIG